MTLDNEMRNEMVKLEHEIALIDEQMEKIQKKLSDLEEIRKKKEHDLKALKENFGIFDDLEYKEIQTTLSRLLKESM